MSQKLKVLILAERFYPEEFIINDLAEEWAAKDFEVDVLTQAPSYPFGKIFAGYSNRFLSHERWQNINIIRFFTVTGYRESLFLKLLNYLSFAIIGSVVALIIGGKYDRVFVYDTGPLTMAVPAFFLRFIRRKHVTIWVQDVWPDMVYAYGFKKNRFLDYFLEKLVRLVYRGCDRIFISCEGFRTRVEPYAPGKPIDWFPNWPTVTPAQGVDAALFNLGEGFHFTFAGNIGKLQNLCNLIKGFGLARAINPDMQFNIVGDGSELEALKDMVAKENIGGVVFWGRKKQSEMPGFFKASDVMIVSLLDDPVFSLTVPAKFQAYLAFSKPIFAVIKGDVKEMVERFGVGLYAAPESPEMIRDGFLRFYEMGPVGLENFSKNTGKLLEKFYNREKIISGMTELLQRGGAETTTASKIKIFHVLECGDLTGCSRLVAAISNGLNPARFETTIVYALRPGTSGAAFEAQFSSHVRKIYLPEMVRPISPIKDFAALVELKRIFFREKPDVVHCHSSKAGFLGRFAALGAGVPKIFYSSHGYSFRMTDVFYSSRALYLLLELLASRVGEVLVNAPNEFKTARMLSGTKRAHPCYNAIDVSAFVPKYPDPDESSPTIAACGRITSAKNPESFLRLCAKLLARYPSLKVKWIGDGYAEDASRFLDFARRLNIENKIHLTGWLSPRKTYEEVKSCDLIIHYSNWDVLPTAVFEAMALGKPVIGSRTVDQIVNGETGYVVRDENELYQRASELLDSGALRTSMGRAARAVIERDYNLPNLISRLEIFYAGTSRIKKS